LPSRSTRRPIGARRDDLLADQEADDLALGDVQPGALPGARTSRKAARISPVEMSETTWSG
jgi:hypothetical protein